MPTVKTEKKSSPNPEIIELSGESNDEDVSEDISAIFRNNAMNEVDSTFRSCMFPTTSRLNSSNTSADDDDDVQFLRSSAAAGPGENIADPIVVSDSPVREDGPSTSSNNLNDAFNSSDILFDVISGGQYPPPFISSLHFPSTLPPAASSLYQLPSVPHLEYQIRLSFPTSMVVRPTPIYPAATRPPLEMFGPRPNIVIPGLANSDDYVLLGSGATGASQKLIEDYSTKTRFIKRIPSKSKSVQAKRERLTPKCPICLEEFVDKVKIRRLRCIHNFHITCIDQWLKKNMICPVCRKSIIAR